MKEEQHIPTLVALIILVVGLGSLLFIFENRTILFAKAASTSQPKGITITNVGDTTATINWLTDQTVVGYVKIREPGLLNVPTVYYDSRDGQGKFQKRQVHSVTIADLRPGFSYSFEIVSGNTTYKDNLLTVTTGPAIDNQVSAVKPAFGTLVSDANTAVDEALVYASYEGSQTVSTVVNQGSWILPFGALRARDISRHFVPQKTDVVQFQFVHPKGVSAVSATSENDSPLPVVRLGQNYDFTKQKNVHLGPIIAQAKVVSAVSGSVTSTGDFQITSPQKDAAIPSQKPAFKGKGTADKYVILTISGGSRAPLSEKVIVDADGRWSWSVTTPLPAGLYTITAASFTADDKPLVVSQGFTILKSGSQVLGDATPSASTLPSPTVSLSPSPSASQTIPVTGTTDATYALLIGGVLLLIFGFAGFSLEKRTQ